MNYQKTNMTHHYTIEIIKTGVCFKATYRNNKFKRIEHLRGSLERSLMNNIGRIIPTSEDEIPLLSKSFFGKINYRIEVPQQQTLFSLFAQVWFDFYKAQTEIEPKFTGADGKGLKQIISYFKQQTGSEEEAFATWQALLENWNCLSDFHKKQLDIKYINSKLNVIITEIKNKKSTNIRGTNRSVEL